jgi:hypothetical protein
VWEGAAGTWPKPLPHTGSDCGRLTGNSEVIPLAVRSNFRLWGAQGVTVSEVIVCWLIVPAVPTTVMV